MYSLKEEKISQITPFSVLADNKRIRNKIIDGKSTQATRSGKNLFDASKISNSNIIVSDNGKTIKMPIDTSGNGYTQVGTNLKGICPKLEVGDTVYLLGDTTSQKNKFIYLGGNSKFIWGFGKSRTLTENDLNAAFVLYGNNFEKGETEQVTISNLRIVKNADDEWEPYGASPSPEFPSEIKSVGDEGTVTIEQRGKNLAKIINGTVIYGDNKFNVKNGTLTIETSLSSVSHILLSGLQVRTWAYLSTELSIIPDARLTKNGGNYIFNIDSNYPISDLAINAYIYTNKRIIRVPLKTSRLQQITLDNDEYIMNIGMWLTSGIDLTGIYFKFQLEEGTELTSFEPYFNKSYTIQTAPLRSLPNGTKDTIEEDGIHRRVGSKIITMNDIAEANTSYSNVVYAQITKPNNFIGYNNYNYNAVLCNKAESLKLPVGNFDNNKMIGKINTEANKTMFWVGFPIGTTLSEMKTQLNGMIILYELKEEIIEPYTEEQQAVLNSMKTFEGTNNFSLIGDLQTTLTFDYNPKITEEIKRAFKYNITKAYLEVAATDKASSFQINEDNYLQSIDFDDCRYIEGEGIIGSCVAKELQGKFVNVDTSFDIENRELECFIGAETEDNITHYLKLGTFIVQKPENDNVKENTSFDSLDYMIKFNKEYVHRMSKYLKTKDTDILQNKQYYILNDSGVYEEVIVPNKEEIINYYEIIDEYTLMQLLKDICEQCEVKLGTFNFRNANYLVKGNRFDTGTTCRDVLKAIAQAAFSWARINEYNELLLDFETSDTITEEIDYNEYYGLNFNNNYGPVNTIVLKNSQAEGENITVQDETLVKKYGIKELSISDNPFAYSEETRKAIIEAGKMLYGFTYVPLTVETIGAAYLNCKDKIKVKNMQDGDLETYVFDTRISYQGALKSNVETLAMTDTETKYRYDGSLTTAQRRTEFRVDKAEQKIESVIINVTEQNNKISQVTQTVDELNSKISDIADITTSQESINGKVSLEKINQSEPIYVKIYPRAENISYLYPHSNLYPNETLYLKTRTLRFANTTTNKYVDYELPDNLLYYDAENYDEFILDYDAQSCVINKKVGYNADGTTYLLENPTTIEYEYPTIELEDGDYTVELLGYTDAYLFVRLMAQNIYTTQFTTRAEVNSEISQTEKNIDLNVNEKLSNYSTTKEMNSAINIASNKINLKVEKKVNEEDFTGANIMLAINNDTSSAVIKADKISLNGKEIDLTSDNTTINSTNFSVDKDGNMSCSNANITGGQVTLYGEPEAENPTLKIINPNQPTTYVDITSGRMRGYGDGFLHTIFYYNIGTLNLRSSLGTRSLFSGSMVSLRDENDEPVIQLFNDDGSIKCVSLTQTSLEESKKNFEKLENGLDIVKNTDIYKYNLKSQEDTDKKHIGFVIGDKYNYSQEITSQNNDGVDTYSMISVAYKAIQEQQELIEQLQNEIKELKGEK